MADKKYYGIYQGIVTNINDPEKRGRIKVKCPDVLGGSAESAWCDPMIPVAYDYGGDFCIPPRNEAVWVQFIAGNPNRPVWLGGWWSRSATPIGENYTNIDKLRFINYADCTILFQNGTISMNIGNGASNLMIENDKITINGNLVINGNVIAKDLGADSVQTVNLTAVETIEASKVVSVDIEAENIIADVIESEGVNLATHKHSGVESGSDSTSSPTKS